jgi:D-cysteine desulfhydrase
MLDARIPIANLPTPLVPLDRLGAAIGLRPGQLLGKLDDATGLAGGGNKVRKLEYLCAEARAQGCDTLVTGGAQQSNHARLTAAAARRLGFECTLVLTGPVPEPPIGNVVLERILGADIRWVGEYDFLGVEAGIAAVCDELTAAGRRPYLVPIGGSTPVGALGYARCALELRQQAPDLELVVLATGSGGTHAGLAAGFGDHNAVLGIDVGARPGLDRWVEELGTAAAALAQLPAPRGTAQLDRDHVGAHYAAHSDECRAAIQLTARLEGLVLDPVCTGKAMAGLIANARAGRFAQYRRIAFMHTGGLPALFTPANAAWATAGGC